VLEQRVVNKNQRQQKPTAVHNQKQLIETSFNGKPSTLRLM